MKNSLWIWIAGITGGIFLLKSKSATAATGGPVLNYQDIPTVPAPSAPKAQAKPVAQTPTSGVAQTGAFDVATNPTVVAKNADDPNFYPNNSSWFGSDQT